MQQQRTWKLGSQQMAGRSRVHLSVITLLLLATWSLLGGWGLSQTANASETQDFTLARVDVLPERLELGEQVYLRECASCHIAPSPAVLPTQSWARILVQADHYGNRITPLQPPVLDLVWEYVRYTSRPVSGNAPIPDRLRTSQFFRALHPRVEFQDRPNLATCVSCHPGAGAYNFRELSAEWENAP